MGRFSQLRGALAGWPAWRLALAALCSLCGWGFFGCVALAWMTLLGWVDVSMAGLALAAPAFLVAAGVLGVAARWRFRGGGGETGWFEPR